MNYRDFTLEDWIGRISEVMEDYSELDGNEMRDLVGFLSRLPKWVSASERLPEENGRYFVTRGLNACGALWNRVYIVNYSDLMGLKQTKIWWNGNVGKSDFETYNDILAWMPLPKPYKAESEE